MRKWRKGKTRDVRVCDNCEDKKIYDAVTKGDAMAEEEISTREEIVRLKHLEVEEVLAGKEKVMEEGLMRKMGNSQRYERENEPMKRKV